MTVFATITANIEVLLLIDAFGMEMTLGNILFAMTFLITDILSERKEKACGQFFGCDWHWNLCTVYFALSVVAAVPSKCQRLGTAGFSYHIYQYAAYDAGLSFGVCNRSNF